MSKLNAFFIRLSSQRVGEDAAGNSYWQARRAQRDGRPRRFVLYAGAAEASTVPPHWWGWLHHSAEKLPEASVAPWQKPHLANLTGSALAYRPQGSDLRAGRPSLAAGSYEAWTPGTAAGAGGA